MIRTDEHLPEHGGTVFTDARGNGEANSREELIVELQGRGPNPPLFAIMVPGMGTLHLATLSKYLGEQQPFYKIQKPGPRLRGRPYSAKEFENLAAEYIAVMKTVQPQGPYHLYGMCEGARIAFDMARLLEREGQAVALLAIIDTWVLENVQIKPLWKINYYVERFQKLCHLSLPEKKKMCLEVIQHRVARRKPRQTGPRANNGPSWPATYWPGKDFVAPKFSGKITVFKRRIQPYFYIRDQFLGWGTRTTGQVELHIIDPFPAKHWFLFREPYISQLSTGLIDCLERASKGTLYPTKWAGAKLSRESNCDSRQAGKNYL